jgi:hypothetical protein
VSPFLLFPSSSLLLSSPFFLSATWVCFQVSSQVSVSIARPSQSTLWSASGPCPSLRYQWWSMCYANCSSRTLMSPPWFSTGSPLLEALSAMAWSHTSSSTRRAQRFVDRKLMIGLHSKSFFFFFLIFCLNTGSMATSSLSCSWARKPRST